MIADHPSRRSYQRFATAAFVLSLLFAWPLAQLAILAASSDLHSHVVLIPAVSVWLVWMRRHELPAPSGPGWVGVGLGAGLGVLALLRAFVLAPAGTPDPLHPLTWSIAAYGCVLVAAVFGFLGPAFARKNAVALGFLVFMVPMPGWLEQTIEVLLQHASAEATAILLSLGGIPFLRDGQIFRLPSITMEIAQECSGIRSSLVLFITSIVAGQMFLKAGWRRWVFTLAVIPLAIVRNGFRVFTLGYLCENIGPHMIHHWIHHRGGPVFFALSLIPFFALLYLLRERGPTAPPEKRPEVAGSAAVGRTSAVADRERED